MKPHPFPMMAHDLQAVISSKVHQEFLDIEGRLPTAIIKFFGDWNNAIGSFYNLIYDDEVRLIGC